MEEEITLPISGEYKPTDDLFLDVPFLHYNSVERAIIMYIKRVRPSEKEAIDELKKSVEIFSKKPEIIEKAMIKQFEVDLSAIAVLPNNWMNYLQSFQEIKKFSLSGGIKITGELDTDYGTIEGHTSTGVITHVQFDRINRGFMIDCQNGDFFFVSTDPPIITVEEGYEEEVEIDDEEEPSDDEEYEKNEDDEFIDDQYVPMAN